MNVLGIHLTLLLGPEVPVPASPLLLEALLDVNIEQKAAGVSLCQLSFRADPASLLSLLNPIVEQPQLDTWNRAVVIVTNNLVPTVLFDGLITHTQLSPGSGGTPPTYTVTCEDLSALMDRTEHSREWPAMTYEEVALAVLAEYAEYGIVPEAVPPLIEDPPLPSESVHVQNATDRAFLTDLAARVGWIFAVYPGEVPLTNTAYWGPPKYASIPQPALSVNMGAGTNVESLDFSYSPLDAVFVSGAVLETEAGPAEEVPVQTVIAERLPLSTEPALLADATHPRTRLVDHGGADVMATWQLSQARTDLSTDKVATATGSLDGLRYGSVLTAGGLVGVRGAGLSFDGLWFVRSVTHSLQRSNYKQNFELSRGGLVSNVPVVRT